MRKIGLMFVLVFVVSMLASDVPASYNNVSAQEDSNIVTVEVGQEVIPGFVLKSVERQGFLQEDGTWEYYTQARVNDPTSENFGFLLDIYGEPESFVTAPDGTRYYFVGGEGWEDVVEQRQGENGEVYTLSYGTADTSLFRVVAFPIIQYGQILTWETNGETRSFILIDDGVIVARWDNEETDISSRLFSLADIEGDNVLLAEYSAQYDQTAGWTSSAILHLINVQDPTAEVIVNVDRIVEQSGSSRDFMEFGGTLSPDGQKILVTWQEEANHEQDGVNWGRQASVFNLATNQISYTNILPASDKCDQFVWSVDSFEIAMICQRATDADDIWFTGEVPMDDLVTWNPVDGFRYMTETSLPEAYPFQSENHLWWWVRFDEHLSSETGTLVYNHEDIVNFSVTDMYDEPNISDGILYIEAGGGELAQVDLSDGTAEVLNVGYYAHSAVNRDGQWMVSSLDDGSVWVINEEGEQYFVFPTSNSYRSVVGWWSEE